MNKPETLRQKKKKTDGKSRNLEESDLGCICIGQMSYAPFSRLDRRKGLAEKSVDRCVLIQNLLNDIDLLADINRSSLDCDLQRQGATSSASLQNKTHEYQILECTSVKIASNYERFIVLRVISIFVLNF